MPASKAISEYHQKNKYIGDSNCNFQKELIMLNKYTAKVHFSDGEVIESSGDNLEQLQAWIYTQGEVSSDEVKGEILDNKTHQIIKKIQYTPNE